MMMPRARVRELLKLRRSEVKIDPLAQYTLVGVYSFGKGIFHREPQLGAELGDYRFFEIKPGDLVLSNIQAWEGAVGTHRFLSYASTDERIDTNWAHYFFLSEAGSRLIQQAAPGTVKRNRTLSIDRFEALEIPLPPIEQQRRVAARLDRVTRLRTDFRELIVRSERLSNALVESRLDSVNPVAPKRAIGDLAEIRSGIQKTPLRVAAQNPVRYLTVAHVGRDTIKTDDPRYFDVAPIELGRWRLQAGDVLIIEGNGSSEQTGRSAIFRGEIDNCVHQNHVIRVRTDAAALDPYYLNDFLNSPAGRGAVQAQARTSSGLRSLSVGRIAAIGIPVPSLAAQRHYVALSEEIKNSAKRLAALRGARRSLSDGLPTAVLNDEFADCL
jgi:type I restriction enzyme S subunit